MLCWVRIRRLVRDPCDVACGQREDLRCLSTDISKLLTVESASLQVESIKLDGSSLIKLTIFEGGNEFELIDGNLELSGGSLSESIKEGLWVEKITQVNWAPEESTLLYSTAPLDESITLLVDGA